MSTEFAPAKINLSLKVLGRRPDGYHELQSLVVFADVGDELALDGALARGCRVIGPFAAQLDGVNLIDQTLELLAAHDPQLRLGAVHLQKNLPVAAGIGGGSADAAAVLRLIRRANPEKADEINWHELALQLGADVPVCLAGVPAMMSGIGDQIVPLDDFPLLNAVLVNPLAAMPVDKTAQVFARLNAPKLREDVPRPPVPQQSLSQKELLAYVMSSGNDLQTPCQQIAPVITDVLNSISATPACRLARMSGAGPTCFGLYDDAEGAQAGAAELLGAYPGWWIRAVRLGQAGRNQT